MGNVIVITGASSGFGALTARSLAHAGNTVHAGMRETTGRNAPQVRAAADFARRHDVDLRPSELDVNSQESVDAAIARVEAEHGRIDVLIHNAGHLATGPAEAFTPEQLAELYDVNVLSTQRVNRAALPGMRRRGEGPVMSSPTRSSPSPRQATLPRARRPGGRRLRRGLRSRRPRPPRRPHPHRAGRSALGAATGGLDVDNRFSLKLWRR